LEESNNHGPPKPTFSEVLLVNNLVFRPPKPVFFMVLGQMYVWLFFRGFPNIENRRKHRGLTPQNTMGGNAKIPASAFTNFE